MSNRLLARMAGVTALAVSATGCIFPGAGTLLEKGYAEIRGGWGEAREIQAFAAGPVLDRFRAVKVARVERSADAGPLPGTLSAVVETELRSALKGANLFRGGPGPTLLIRARLTTHWPASLLAASVLAAAPSEIAARVEFLEEGRRAPLGIYYVRGLSTALARKSDEDLGRGLASGVIEVIESRRTPPPAPEPLAVRDTP